MLLGPSAGDYGAECFKKFVAMEGLGDPAEALRGAQQDAKQEWRELRGGVPPASRGRGAEDLDEQLAATLLQGSDGGKEEGTPASRLRAHLHSARDKRQTTAEALHHAILSLGPPGELKDDVLVGELLNLYRQLHVSSPSPVESEKGPLKVPEPPSDKGALKGTELPPPPAALKIDGREPVVEAAPKAAALKAVEEPALEAGGPPPNAFVEPPPRAEQPPAEVAPNDLATPAAPAGASPAAAKPTPDDLAKQQLAALRRGSRSFAVLLCRAGKGKSLGHMTRLTTRLLACVSFSFR